ncbi:hypothetical protein BCV70DRAFT_3662 [Testicularia cyperi]|uniref:Uncharacterized protein n=1 Tax=Testicularia cyperi TaxID=1882483 RepID=A0A317XWI1_9BASI|nr:hypothetical protein BCV70DRAFT_3662 [Testicularia cyperi]
MDLFQDTGSSRVQGSSFSSMRHEPKVSVSASICTTSSVCSSSGSTHDEYRVLQPGDFRRTKSHLVLRPGSASRTGLSEVLEFSHAAGSRTSSQTGSISVSPRLRAEPELVDAGRTRPRVAHGRRTFGRRSGSKPSTADSLDATALDTQEELVSLDDASMGPDSDVEDDVQEAKVTTGVTSPIDHAQSSTLLSSNNSELMQLKQQASQAWAQYRTVSSPNWPSSDEGHGAILTSVQPKYIPQRVTSLRRSSVVLSAMPRIRSGSASTVTGATTKSRSAPSTSARAAFDILFSDATAAKEYRPSTAASAFASEPPRRSSAPQPDQALSHRRTRPHTASTMSSRSESSFHSYQNSIESGRTPLLLSQTSARRTNALYPAAASALLGPDAIATSSQQPWIRDSSVSQARPETRNNLSVEERRQQVKRTQKLTKMLGEEMLLAASGEQASPFGLAGRSAVEAKRKSLRPQSVSLPFNDSLPPIVAPTIIRPSTNKGYTLAQKLRSGRLHTSKSVGDVFASDLAYPSQSVSLKAATILGIPHPYSSAAFQPEPQENTMRRSACVGRESFHPRPLIPVGFEDLNEPTPKISQLAAFAGAALDEALSPTLPQDPTFEPFETLRVDHEVAAAEARELAVLREERRRRVAKMSRWLGEAVPVSLVAPRQSQKVRLSTISHGTHVEAALLQDSLDSSHSSTRVSRSLACDHRDRSEREAAFSDSHSSLALPEAPWSGSHDHSSPRSNLQSFMSIDSSDSEDEGERHGPSSSSRRPLALSTAHGEASQSGARAAVTGPQQGLDALSAYRKSIDSYDYLLRNDRERLSELASMFTGSQSCHMTRSGDALFRHSGSLTSRAYSSASHVPSLAHCERKRRGSHNVCEDAQGNHLSASVGDQPRRSAAFLELSDSGSESSDLEDIAEEGFKPRSISRHSSIPASDRSLSKLSNFFGSTPSQIIRSQTFHSMALPAEGEFQGSKDRQMSNPEALRTILRSLEEEALDDTKLNMFQKSEITRKVQLLRKRTTKMFT